MEEYIKKLEAENKRLAEELMTEQVINSSKPLYDNLCIEFCVEYDFGGFISHYSALLRYVYANPKNGNDDPYSKEIRVYRQEIKNPTKIDDFVIHQLLYKINDDLKDFFHTNLLSFKTEAEHRSLDVNIPWLNDKSSMFIPSNYDFESLKSLFQKRLVLTTQPFNRTTRWVRFKQFIKGV
jgi:hypothetical protein